MSLLAVEHRKCGIYEDNNMPCFGRGEIRAMAKKKQTNQPSSERTNIVIFDKYTLRTKFQKRALVPSEVIDKNWLGIWCFSEADRRLKDSAVFVTTDGHRVRIKLIGCCNNSKGDQYEWLQDVAEKTYGLKFETIQSNWYARLGNLSGYWHLIEMEEAV